MLSQKWAYLLEEQSFSLSMLTWISEVIYACGQHIAHVYTKFPAQICWQELKENVSVVSWALRNFRVY